MLAAGHKYNLIDTAYFNILDKQETINNEQTRPVAQTPDKLGSAKVESFKWGQQVNGKKLKLVPNDGQNTSW